MKIEKKHIIIILCIVSLISWLVSYLQGWGAIQFQWFLAIILFIVVISGVTYRRETKILKLTKIKESAENYLKDHDLKDSAKITRIFRRDKIKSDGLWEVVYDGNPVTKVLFDLKGTPVGLELKGESEPSPLKFPIEERPAPHRGYIPKQIKEEIKKEVKTD